MQQSTIHKSKQFFALVIKLFIVIGCGYFIYYKLTKNNQLSFLDFYSNLVNANIFSIKNISILLLLSSFNWFFEILKWQTLVSFFKKIHFINATKQCLSSLTASLLTPNRIGEYGAKAIYFEKKLRKKVLVLNLIGNVFQLIITLFFGFLGVLFFILTLDIEIPIKQSFILLISSLVIITTLLILYKRKVTFKGYSLESLFNFIKKIPKQLLANLGWYSFIRYVIFSHQFYFLLFIFNVDISYFNALFSIFLMYFLSSIVPMLSIFDVVLKSSVAIWIFSFFNCNETTILSITLIMWIFNFVFPSCIGSYFVLTFDTTKIITQKE